MTYPSVNPLKWETIQPYVDDLLAAPLTANTADAWLQEWSNLSAVLQEAYAQILREITENTADRDAEARFETYVREIAPRSKAADQALRDRLLASNGYTPSDETRQLVQRFRAEARIYRQENLPLLTELAMLENEYNKIAGALTVDWEGQPETLPMIRQRQRSPDRQERERAWRLEMGAFAARREELNTLYLKMLSLRRQVARNAGLPDFRAYRWLELHRFDYRPEDCFTFHQAIEREIVPLASALARDLRETLGLDAVRPWDVEADPYGKPLRPFSEVAELEEGAARIFGRVHPDLAAHFATLRDGYLDLASRPNKAPGGYCESFPVSGRAYIFMNAVGSEQDVNTILHEGGHAFHFLESRRHPLIWNHNGPMEFCEVASMGMELLAAPYLAAEEGGFYSEPDARRAYADELRSIVRFLPYMAVVDAFQHWVYTEAPDQVTAADLDARWAELWDRFMPWVDYTDLQAEKEAGWHRKQHIFQDPFYYVEYGLAQAGALQVWRNALRDQAAAVADYRAALALGNTRSLSELFRAAGARFAFDRGTVAELATLITGQLSRLTPRE